MGLKAGLARLRQPARTVRMRFPDDAIEELLRRNGRASAPVT